MVFSFVQLGYKNIMKEMLDYWKNLFATNMKEAYDKLMELDANCVSTRAYMMEFLRTRFPDRKYSASASEHLPYDFWPS
jgi:hypothetical protein